MKRIFLGIPIDENLKKEIGKWLDSNRIIQRGIRQIPNQNLHITLIPPWYEENVNSAIGILNDIRGMIKPFLIQFDKVSFGPSNKNPRLIWATGKTPIELVQLNELAHELYNVKKEKRPILLHITLARFKHSDYKNFVVKKIDQNILWSMKVNKVCLYESRLSPKGAVYNVLSFIKLNDDKNNLPLK